MAGNYLGRAAYVKLPWAPPELSGSVPLRTLDCIVFSISPPVTHELILWWETLVFRFVTTHPHVNCSFQ